MPHACDVAGCPNGARRQYCNRGTYLSFHWMPQNEPLRSKWLSVTPLRQSAKQSNAVRVCSLHFRAEDYETNRNLVDAFNVPLRAKLRPSAVPSVFPKSESQLDTVPELPVSDNLKELRDDDATECTESGTTDSAIDTGTNTDAKVAVHAETQTNRSLRTGYYIGYDKSVQVRLRGKSIGVQVNLTLKNTEERRRQVRKRKKPMISTRARRRRTQMCRKKRHEKALQ
ncbi:uncharacterized protein LOC119163110 [Rhipicephalus microplus]|uniref:uncharacterized protein LOC119163110 n=1 Tax=Rhipicephalus microplus TaxID=6941 RepID=UPI003F6C9933